MKSCPGHRFFFAALVLMAVVGLLAEVANCGTYGGGTGEPNDPYLIFDANQMNAIGINPSDWNRHFKLMADIDLGAFAGTAYNIIGKMSLYYPSDIALDVAGGKMYWVDSGAGKIQRANLDGTGIEDLVTEFYTQLIGIALDVSGGKMYWTAQVSDKIQRANLDGTGIEDLVTGLPYPGTIALDVPGGKMYWTDTVADKIQCANLDGTGVEDLLTGLPAPIGIALDLTAGKMYWTDTMLDKVQRASLDGTEVEDVVTGLSFPTDIALDVAGGKMYWVDTGAGKIQRANLDGTGLEDLVTSEAERPDYLAVDTAEGKIYWTVRLTDKIKRANLDGALEEDLVASFFAGIFNGNGHKVLNFSCLSRQDWGTGLLGIVDGPKARIKDLGIINPVVEGETGDAVGALVGQLSNGEISGCFIEGGSVSGGRYVGGLVGYNHGVITDCYATDNVSGNRYIGGLVGYNSYDSITNCYAAGSLSGSAYVGGLVGSGDSSSVSGSFWDIVTSGQLSSAGGTGLTTANMQTMSTFTDAGWDFNTPIWTIDEGNDYPRLWWERCPMPPIEVSMKFTPQALNPGSKGKWVKAYFVLPEDFGVDDVDANTPAVIVPLGIESDYINVFINEDGLVEIEAAFERAAFCGAGIDYGPAEVTVTGRLISCEYFYGTDTIKIITNGIKYLAVLSSYWLESDCGAPDWCSGVDLDQNTVVDFVDFALFDGCCIEVVKE